MVGVITDPIEDNRALATYGVDAIPSSTGEVLRATAGQAYDTSITPLIGRSLEREGQFRVQSEDPVQNISPEQEAFQEGNADSTRGYVEKKYRLLDPEEANARYGIKGHLSFDAQVPEPTAQQLNGLKRDELYRQSVLQRAEGGVGQFLGKLGTGLLVSAADPLNIASAFIPVVGEARYASWLAKAGSAAGRAQIRVGVGAAEGAVGTAVLEPFVYSMARSEQQDYNATDSLMNIAFGTVLGGGLHAGAGAIGDRITGRFSKAIEAATPETREAALRTAVSQVADGRPVDVEAILRNENLARFDTLRDRLLSSVAAPDAQLDVRVGMRGLNRDEMAARLGDTKVVTPEGDPLVVFHGTTEHIDRFDPNRLGDATGAPSAKEGFFFTSDPELASSYAVGFNPYRDMKLFNAVNKITAGAYESLNESLLKRFGKTAITSGENVVPAHLSIKNPLVHDFNGSERRDVSFASLLKEAKEAGHDGAIFRNAVDPGFSDTIGQKPADIYVAFSPHQIVSPFESRPEVLARSLANQRAAMVNDLRSTLKGNISRDAERFLSPEDRAAALAIQDRVAQMPRTIETVADAEKALQVEMDSLKASESDVPLTEQETAYLAEADEMVKQADARAKAARAGAACMAMAAE